MSRRCQGVSESLEQSLNASPAFLQKTARSVHGQSSSNVRCLRTQSEGRTGLALSEAAQVTCGRPLWDLFLQDALRRSSVSLPRSHRELRPDAAPAAIWQRGEMPHATPTSILVVLDGTPLCHSMMVARAVDAVADLCGSRFEHSTKAEM